MYSVCVETSFVHSNVVVLLLLNHRLMFSLCLCVCVGGGGVVLGPKFMINVTTLILILSFSIFRW